MKKLIFLLPILLIACTLRPPTPTTADAYFAARYSYTVMLAGAVGYKDVCHKQVKTNHCYVVVAKLRQLDDSVKAAETKMDAAISSGNLPAQQIALALFNSAAAATKTYKEKEIVQ